MTDKDALKKDIHNLIDKHCPDIKTDLLKKFVHSAVQFHNEEPEPEEILPLIEGLDEIRESIKMFHAHKYDPKISVFGSARTKPEDPLYKITEEFSYKAALKGYKIITGGGPGIMEAGNKGAGAENSFGLGLRLPFESANEIFADYPEHFTYFKHFYSRKLTFYRESDAIVVVPGGYGTMDEIFQGLASIQTGKYKVRPFIILDTPDGNFWNSFDKWIQNTLLKNKYIIEDDLMLYDVMTNTDNAIKKITGFYKNYHSYFSYDRNLIFQLKIDLTNGQLKDLNSFSKELGFADFIFTRERYYNYSTLYLYRTVLNTMNMVNIVKVINFINTL